MMRPATIRIIVLMRKLSHGEVCRKNLLSTERSKNPITKLTSNTFTSRSKIALKVFEPGSLYLNEKESELNCIRKRKKSARVQHMAMIRMMGSLRLVTADPVGTISFERLINDN